MASLLLTTWVAACGDGAFDVSPDAVYVLSRVNGEELPAILWLSQFASSRVEADTIRFIGGARFEEVRWTSVVPRSSDAVTLERQVWTGVVRPVDGGFVMISDVCLDPGTLALCVEPDTAVAGHGGLVLRGPAPPAGVKRYEAR